MILHKTLEMDQPLWIISLDLSKAFDRVNWESLWHAVGVHGISPHLVWILQRSTVNPVCPIGQPVSGTEGGNCETASDTSPIAEVKKIREQ